MKRLFVVFSFVAVTCPSIWAAERPNVIVIFTDDHGFTDLACQGIRDDLVTPNIDALAEGGVRMTSGYVTAPQCVPSRAGILSGRYQNRFGVESNGDSLDGFNAQQTIAERLKTVGYATGMAGKWHLGPANEITSHGFDDVYYKNSNRPGWSNFNLNGTDRKPSQENEEGYHIDVCTDAACAFIKRHKSKPFFFYCAYRAPHVPLDATQKYLDRFPGEMPTRRRKALAMISAMDDGVGRIMQTLRENQLEEKTLVFFIGDNGAPLKIHKDDAPGNGAGWDGSLNEPLNGEKGMLSEGGIRVPFVAYWKGRFKAGTTYNAPVISLDVAATACAMAGLPDDQSLDGVNLVPYLTGENRGVPHQTLYWRWIAQSAIREGQWKYLRGGKREYLFNMTSDKEEKHNLISEQPEVAKRLRGKLSAWSNELQPPGLATKQMSTVWEAYYDFYLDGKPAPPRRDRPASRNEERVTLKGGWIVRNAAAASEGNMVRIEPRSKKRQKPFITNARLKLPPQFTATLRLISSRRGQAAIAWRERSQKDFVDSQKVEADCKASDDIQTVQLAVSGSEQIIHVRILLPEKGASIESIEFKNKDGQSLRSWTFGK